MCEKSFFPKTLFSHDKQVTNSVDVTVLISCSEILIKVKEGCLDISS